jgi:DNA modification methylase
MDSDEKLLLDWSIKEEGCREPLVVWQGEDILLDGHVRYEVCTRHNIPFDVVYKELPSRDDAKAFIITNQLGRRNLSYFQRAELALQLESIFKAQAAANRGRRTDLSQNSEKSLVRVDTLRELGKIAGVSHDTIAKVKHIRQAAVPELKALLATGEVSINAADTVARLPLDKQTTFAVQGADAVQKAAVKTQEAAKKAARDKRRDEIAHATADKTDTEKVEARSRALRDEYQQEFDTKTGQIWEIRSDSTTHRLLIGDATSADDVNVLLAGAVADIAIVDPPYNVRYVGKTKDALDFGNDNLSPKKFQEFIRQAAANLFKHCKPGAAMFMWHADTGRVQFQLGIEAAGWKVRQTVIWAKDTFVQGRQCYNWQHEPALVCWKRGAPQNWWGGHDKGTVWNEDKPLANREHPTCKPVGLYIDSLLHASREGDIVLDTFCGSGTAMEAAHRTGRTCYAMEKDPGYAAVILKRMQRLGLELRLTGK